MLQDEVAVRLVWAYGRPDSLTVLTDPPEQIRWDDYLHPGGEASFVTFVRTAEQDRGGRVVYRELPALSFE